MSEQKKVLKVDDVMVFIIPNRIGSISNNLVESFRVREEKLFNEIFALNGIDRTIDTEKDTLIQLWFHSKSLGTDNLVRHGGKYIVAGENGVEHIHLQPNIENLPACLFAGVNEGESINLKVPDGDYILDMTVTVDQLNYRYPHGPFEEILEDVANIPRQIKIKDHVMTFNADAFVVPNHADRICDNSYWKTQNNLIAYLDEVCKLNGYRGINIEKDHIVDVWLTSKDHLKSENLSDHGGTIINANGDEEHIYLYYLHLIPEKILHGHYEGETFTFKAPFNRDDPHDPGRGDILLKIYLTMSQKKYRYSRFGNFEDVLERVCIERN